MEAVTLKRVYPKRMCCVCLMEFDLAIERHYIARDKSVSGLSASWSSPEPELYDSVDCPICGCQNILQKRKRNFVDEADFEIDDPEPEDDEEDEPEDEAPRVLDMIDAMRFGVAGVGAPSSLSLEAAIEKTRLISEGLVPPFPTLIMPKEEVERAINSDLENPEATIHCSDRIRECDRGTDELWGCDTESQEADDPELDDDDGPGVDLGEICI